MSLSCGGLRIPGWGWAVLLLVVPALFSFTVFFRAQRKALEGRVPDDWLPPA